MGVNDAVAEVAKEHAGPGGLSHYVGNARVMYRSQLISAARLAADWIVDKAPGATITHPTSPERTVIATGTAVNEVTTLISRQRFTAPVQVGVGLQLSQKIANQEFYVELVAEDSLESSLLDEMNLASWKMAFVDSSDVSTGRAQVRNGNAARIESANQNNQASQVSPSIYEIQMESDEVWFSSKAQNSAAARGSGQIVMNSTAPDPNKYYRIRIRAVNGSTAPASSTNFTLFYVYARDISEMQMEIIGGNGNTALAQAIPVSVRNNDVIQQAMSVAPATGTGLVPHKVLSSASLNPTLVRNAQNRLWGYRFANFTASWRFVKFYNKAANPTVGTDAVHFTVAIPPNAVVYDTFAVPLSFNTGISYGITGAVADADTTTVGAGDVQGTIYTAT